jgi:riboflavin biosynthesis pyrimidine reductase
LGRAFLEAGLVDKLLLFVAPKLAGDGPLLVPGVITCLPVTHLTHLTSRQVGEDVLLEAYLREP